MTTKGRRLPVFLYAVPLLSVKLIVGPWFRTRPRPHIDASLLCQPSTLVFFFPRRADLVSVLSYHVVNVFSVLGR